MLEIHSLLCLPLPGLPESLSLLNSQQLAQTGITQILLSRHTCYRELASDDVSNTNYSRKH